MASSGQVLAHRPHCTQLLSVKRSCGLSGLSASAASGQALTQLRHSVQRSASTSRLPRGEPGGQGDLVGTRWAPAPAGGQWPDPAWPACRPARQSWPAGPRSAPARRARRRPARPGRGHRGPQQPQVLARVAQARQHGLRHVHLFLQGLAVLGRFFVGEQHPHLAGALGDGGQPQVEADAGRVPHRHRQHACRQALQAAVAPAQAGAAAQFVEQPRASGFAVDQQRGVAAAGMAVGREHGAQPPALVHRAG
jgi:hypothetical protein